MTRARAVLGGILLGVVLMSGCTSSTTPTASPTASSSADKTARLPQVADPLALKDVAAFSGVAALEAGSNCTGTLIDTKVPSGPAYVLTNGHCVGDVGRAPQQTTIGKGWSGTAEFLRVAGHLDNTLTVNVVQLAYSTMRHTDTAIVRLDRTLADLEDLGIRPVPLATAEPAQGSDVTNIGVPVQDLPVEDWVLRHGACQFGAQHTVIELGWLWNDVWSNTCPGIIQGSSGSPLFSLDAAGAPSAIVGMINTTTWGVSAADGGACFINRPCEVTADGVRMVEQTSYAQSVAGLAACFDQSGGFALEGACPLPRSDIWAESGGGTFQGGHVPNAAGAIPQVSLVGLEAGTARTALVPLGDATACQRAETYAGSRSVTLPKAGEPWEAVGVTVPVNLPETEGHYLLCAVRGAGYAAAASVLFEVDRTPPLFKANAEVTDIGGGNVVVSPHLNPPEISTVRFAWGKPDLDCSNRSAFQDFFIVPLTIEAHDLPARYCVYGLDAAGNATDITTIDIP